MVGEQNREFVQLFLYQVQRCIYNEEQLQSKELSQGHQMTESEIDGEMKMEDGDRTGMVRIGGGS